MMVAEVLGSSLMITDLDLSCSITEKYIRSHFSLVKRKIFKIQFKSISIFIDVSPETY